MKPLSVLHINTEPDWRGGEAQTLMLARGLVERGHKSILAAMRGGALEKKARAQGIEVVGLPMRGEFDPISIVGIARTIRRGRVDILHYHTSHAVTLGTLATYIAGRRPAVLTRRVSFSLKRNPAARVKYALRIDHLIAVADGVRWIMIADGSPPDRVSVIHSGIDLARFGRPRDRGLVEREFGIAPDAFLVGSVSHLAAHKGIEVLLEALADVAAEVPSLRVLIVGEGSERARLESAAAAGALAGRVVFAGFREDVPALMASLDLFVLPSLSGEGSPAVLKEAMASGVAPVATDLDGIREIVEDEREALLVPAGDAAKLAKAVKRLASDPARRAAMAEAGRTRVREFSSQLMVDRTIEIYRQVMQRRGARG
jgi:L-malate glycosyltransferase